jgi:septum formation protein
VSAPPAPPLVLASTSPQRRAILEQLGLPFDVVPPSYVEDDGPEASPEELVKVHAVGKAHSVADGAGERPVLGVDTAVVLDGIVYGKPQGAGQAEEMLEALSGRTHEVVSGLCLLTLAWEVAEAETTRVSFRA